MLGGVVDRVIPLDDDSVGVVKDALAILTCKEIKLSSLRRYDKLATSMHFICRQFSHYCSVSQGIVGGGMFWEQL